MIDIHCLLYTLFSRYGNGLQIDRGEKFPRILWMITRISKPRHAHHSDEPTKQRMKAYQTYAFLVRRLRNAYAKLKTAYDRALTYTKCVYCLLIEFLLELTFDSFSSSSLLLKKGCKILALLVNQPSFYLNLNVHSRILDFPTRSKILPLTK